MQRSRWRDMGEEEEEKRGPRLSGSEENRGPLTHADNPNIQIYPTIVNERI